MKNLVRLVFFSLLSIFSFFSIISCKNSNFYKWIEREDGVKYQYTTGVVKHNYEVHDGALEVYAELDGGVLRFQFYEKNKWFEQRKSYIYLLNRKPILTEEEGAPFVIPDFIKCQWGGINESATWEAAEGDSSISKLKSDDSVLCVSGEPLFRIRYYLLSPESKGSIVLTFQDGETKYEFKLYSEGYV